MDKTKGIIVNFSKCETREHIWQVRSRFNVIIKNLMDRALMYDVGKFKSPEVEIPEHYKNGIRDMSLCDLIEMLCNWEAAIMRHADGDIMRSIEINQKRFGYSDELKQIFVNTIENDIM